MNVEGVGVCQTEPNVDQHLAFIELYEYKVADLVRGHEPAGGRRALLELRAVLLQASLDGALSRRLSKVDRLYREFRRQANAGEVGRSRSVQFRPESSAPPLAPSGSALEEARVWRELHQLVWCSQVQERVQQFVLKARSEAGHATLRVVYAVTETAERSLRGVPEAFPVPLSDDPLLSLGDREIALQLGESLCQLLLTPEGEQALLEAVSRTWAQPFPPHVDEAVLAARIESAEREPISQVAREELIQALRAQYPQAPDPRERPAVRLACARLEELLGSVLALRPGMAGLPGRSILYSSDPVAGMIDAPEDQEELVIYLGTDSMGAGQEAYWHGLHLRWQRGGQDWQFMVDKQLALLRPSLPKASRHLKLRVGEETLRVYHSGDYVLLRHTLVPRDALQALARQALLTARLLDPAHTFANLRLGRALARALRDNELDLEEFAAASAEKYGGADAGHLLAFARQGAGTLLSQAGEVTESKVEELLDSLTGLLNLPAVHARTLRQAWQEVQLVTHTTAEASPPILYLRSDGQFGAVKLGDQPLNLHFSGRVVTLNRDYKGDVAVLLPGGSAGEKAVLHDLLVVPVADLSLVLVKWQQWVAATTVRNLALP